MNAFAVRRKESADVQTVPIRAARRTWHIVRLPLLVLLTLLEPVARATFSLAVVLGIFAATVFELSAAGPEFDFLAMLALSFSLGVTLIVYYGLLALVSR